MLWLLACTPSDGQLYAQSAEATDLARASTLCGRIQDDDVRTECQGQLGREHASDPAIEDHCASIQDDRWRDECFFLLAEEVWDAGETRDASRLCTRAGAYLGPCFMHLWAQHAAGLKRELAPDEAVVQYEGALAWAGEHLTEDLERRGWGLYFRTEVGRVDMASCKGDKARLCRAGLREAITRAINRQASRGGPLPCDASDSQARAEALRALIDYTPTPALDTWVKSALEPHCD